MKKVRQVKKIEGYKIGTSALRMRAWNDAESHFRECNTLALRVFYGNENHIIEAMIHLRLARVLFELKRRGDARTIMDKSLSIIEKAMGDTNP